MTRSLPANMVKRDQGTFQELKCSQNGWKEASVCLGTVGGYRKDSGVCPTSNKNPLKFPADPQRDWLMVSDLNLKCLPSGGKEAMSTVLLTSTSLREHTRWSQSSQVLIPLSKHIIS